MDNDLHIWVLGGFRVRVGDADVPAGEWSRRVAASILKILALAPGHRLHREQLMDILWPDSDPRQAANNLYQSLHAARRALERVHPQAGDYLRLQDHIVHFSPDVHVQVDADQFEQAASEARTQREVHLYQKALGLYGGDLLPDDLYESWASERRESLHLTHLELLQRLADAQVDSGDVQAALATLRQLVAAEPLHEPAHQGLMRLYARSGQRKQAIRTYQVLRETLERELGIEPEPEIRRLHDQILAGEIAPSGEQAAPSQQEPDGRTDNLPSALNAFIGREREQAEVLRLLRGTRLLTLTGPGGCGKSRLSIEVAAGQLGNYRDGVWLVELAALSNPDVIPQAIAHAVGIRELPGQPVLDTLSGWFRSREVLLILDNCEHMIDACASVVETLLRSGPELTILATSREPLRIDGETTWLVPSLSLPDPAENLSAEELQQFESIQLFVDRAGRVLPGFSLTAENGSHVAELCYRLDGIPLAIELAASRVRGLPVEQIVERLSDRFQLLSGGSRTALSRQQTLRAALDWSYNLLNERERVLFARLSVFSGGFDVDAVEEICAASPLDKGEVLHLLMLLVDRSLVVASRADGAGRYTLLETMREYGRERLASHGETAAIGAAHARYYADLARHAAGKIRGADQRAWLRRLEREHDNLRRALDWYETDAACGDPEDALLLAGNLYWFWHLHGHYSEGRRRLARLLETPRSQPSRGLGMALTGAGAMFLVVGEYAEAHVYLNDSVAVWRELDQPDGLTYALAWSGWSELFRGSIVVARERHIEALELAQRIGDEWGIAMATLGLGFDAAEADEHQQAFANFERSLEIFRSTNDYWGTTTALQQLAYLTYRTGDFRAARQRAQEVLALEQAEGDRWLEIQSQSLLGEIARAEGDYAAAAASVEICLSMAREIGHAATRAWTLRDAGYIALATGDPEMAVDHLLESLAIFQERRYQLGITCCLAGLAGALVQQDRFEQAAEVLGAVSASLDALQMALAPADRLAVEGFTATARSALGDDAFQSAHSKGASQPLDTITRQVEAHFRPK